MNWKTKSRIQRSIAALPSWLSYPLYYRVQRSFGAMRDAKIDPTSRLQAGLEACRRIRQHGGEPLGARFLEVGTGWRLNLPIACWLCGAESVTTVDLHTYLKASLVQRDLEVIRSRRADFERLLEPYQDLVQADRWQALLETRDLSVSRLLTGFGIDYRAPCDAANLGIDDDSIDYHLSNNTLEHIPPGILAAIFAEARRVVRPGGLMLHRVDHSDHFAHADSGLSRINFLRFREEDWSRWNNNHYAYVNRLREPEYRQLFDRVGCEVLECESTIDSDAMSDLRSGLTVDSRFRSFSQEELAVTASYFVLRPAVNTAVAAA